MQRLGAEAVTPFDPVTEARNIMLMVLIVSLCIITVAIIGQQHASMRRLQRARAKENERRDR